MFLEERRYPPPPDFAAQANAQPDIYDRDFEEFWETEGRERVTWFEPFTSSTSGSRRTPSGISAGS
jgi:acetyl-CoA synthetase